MTTARFNVSQPIVFPDGTMQYPFRDFMLRVDAAIDGSGLTASWGGITGTLSDQADVQAAIDAAALTATWGGVSGTLSSQSDLWAALNAAAVTTWGDITGTIGDQTDLAAALSAAGGSAAWGGITGTLSSQTDLQAALDAKSDLVSVSTVTANHAVPDSTDHAVIVCNNTVDITVTMPTLASNQVTVIRANTGGVTIDGDGEDVQGEATQEIPLTGDAADLIGTTLGWLLK